MTEAKSEKPGSPGRGGNTVSPGVLVAAVLFLAALAYLPCLGNGFINLDDFYYVTKVRPFSVAKIAEAFRSTYEGYHPLTLVSLGLDLHLSGFNPWWFHCHNLLLHLANSVLVYLLLARVFKRPAVALTACLVFALHPVHVEAVAWVTSRKDVLYSFFYFLGLLAYLHYVAGQKWGTYVLALVLFIISAFAKGMAVAFPLTLFCLDYLLERRILSRRVLLEKVPFLLGSLVFGLVSVWGQRASGYIAEAGQMRSLGLRLGLAVYSFWGYVWNLLWPFKLSGFYPYPDTLPGWPPFTFYLALALLLPALAGGIWLLRRNRPVAFCLLFFAVNIALVLQIVPVANFIVANRYNYVSSVGFCALVGLGVARLWEGRDRWRRPAFGIVAVYGFVLALLSNGLCETWRDSVTLWSDVLRKQPDAAFALNMRGCAWNELSAYDKAVADFDRAITVDPTFPRSYLNRGYAKYRLGDLPGAITDYGAALKAEPDNALAFNNRGLALHAQGKLKEARVDFDQAIVRGANRLQAYLMFNNRSMVCNDQGDYAQALADADAALRLKPNYAQAFRNRARARQGLGQTAEALADYARSVELDETDWDAWLSRARLELELGQAAAAKHSVSNAVSAGGEAATAAVEADAALVHFWEAQ